MTKGPLAFCTVVAKNYLARARVMVDSLLRQHPGVAVYVLFVDAPEGCFDPAGERFTSIFLDDLELPRPRELCFRYSVVELSTAVRPFLLRFLLGRGYACVVYLDPDTRVYAALDPALARLEQCNVLLTPHLLEPYPKAEHDKERLVLVCGAYNLGFLGLRRGPETDALLAWLQDRLEYECLVEPEHGLFVDQRWMDLAPGMVDGVHTLRHPGYNVGHWNIDQRPLKGAPEAPHVNGQPLALFHFSGFRPDRPTELSRFDEAPRIDEPLCTLLARYREELLAAGHDTCSRWPYTHGAFSDGDPIEPSMRTVFRTQPPGRFPDPFRVEGPDAFRAFATAQSGTPAIDASPPPPPAGGAPTVRKEDLAPIVQRLLEARPDLLRAVETRDGRLEWPTLLRWLEEDGVRHYALKPEWCARWAGEADTLVSRLLATYDARPELQSLFPLAFVEEHDAPAFADWIEAHAADEAFTADDVLRLRRLIEARPVAHIRKLYSLRHDVAAAYPRAMEWPGDPGFLGWLLESGKREHGLSADWARWFSRSLEQHVCPRVYAAYGSRPEWRHAHPRGLTGLGRRRLLEWLQAERAPELGPRPERVVLLCPPAPQAPMDELRHLYENDVDLQRRFPDALRQLGRTPGLLGWLREQEAAEPGWVDAVETGMRELGLLDHGASVHGFLRAGFGLGELARATVRALEAVDYPVATRSFDHAAAWQSDFQEQEARALPFSIVHLNPDGVRAYRERLDLEVRAGHHRIGYWAWELSEMPPDWPEAASLFDELWTCSRHAAAALSEKVSVPVQVLWPAFEEPPPAPAPGEVTADHDFTFLFVYDLLSETERKNPIGLLHAFREAFRPDDRVRLVLKTANGALRPEALRHVQDAARGLRVSLQDGYLPRSGMFALLRGCDAYVSLHRAEGFGLTLAEAMVLGKPVIATYYSGNVDFMSPWNSFPVPFSMVEIAATHGPYAQGGVWAEPDVKAAAHLMRHVYLQREEAAVVAATGRADVRRLLSPRACGQRMQERFRVVRSRLGHGL